MVVLFIYCYFLKKAIVSQTKKRMKDKKRVNVQIKKNETSQVKNDKPLFI